MFLFQQVTLITQWEKSSLDPAPDSLHHRSRLRSPSATRSLRNCLTQGAWSMVTASLDLQGTANHYSCPVSTWNTHLAQVMPSCRIRELKWRIWCMLVSPLTLSWMPKWKSAPITVTAVTHPGVGASAFTHLGAVDLLPLTNCSELPDFYQSTSWRCCPVFFVVATNK